MTGAGAPGAAGIIKCLLQDASLRLSIADADANAVGRHLHQPFFAIPNAQDPSFADAILDLCVKEKVDLVLPLVTRELFPLSEHRSRFENVGIRVLVSSYDSIQIANNKGDCFQFLKEAGIPVPQFFIVNNAEEFIHAAFELDHPQKPFCFKPTVANGSRGFRIVQDSINEAEQLFTQKPYNTYITYTHAVKILSSQPFPPLVVTEYLPGNEYSVDCVAENGKALLVVPRLRQKMINGISVQGRFENDTAIIAYCTQIIEVIGLHGNIGIQVKRNAAGKPLLLEINPRVQGTIVAALGAGVNLPLLAVHNEMGMPLSHDLMSIKWGVSFSRYWTEVFY